MLPGKLDKYLPFVDEATRAKLYASPTFYLPNTRLEAPSDRSHQRIQRLRTHSSHRCHHPCGPSLRPCFLIKDRKLNDKQNCVSDELAGMRRLSNDSSQHSDDSVDAKN